MAGARVELARRNLEAATIGSTGLVTTFVTRRTTSVRSRGSLYAPVDTGRLRSSLTQVVLRRGTTVIGMVGSDVDYAEAVHDGTKGGSVTVRGHAVRGHQVKGSAGRAAYSRQAHTRSAHTRTLPTRAGRPFLRRALTEVLSDIS